MVERSGEKQRVKDRRRDLEIGACWAGLCGPNGSDEGRLTSPPGDKTQRDGDGKEKGRMAEREKLRPPAESERNKVRETVNYLDWTVAETAQVRAVQKENKKTGSIRMEWIQTEEMKRCVWR